MSGNKSHVDLARLLSKLKVSISRTDARYLEDAFNSLSDDQHGIAICWHCNLQSQSGAHAQRRFLRNTTIVQLSDWNRSLKAFPHQCPALETSINLAYDETCSVCKNADSSAGLQSCSFILTNKSVCNL